MASRTARRRGCPSGCSSPCRFLPQFLADARIATHHLVHVFKGAELAGTICAHPLRGRGYDQDTPLLMADFVTTEAGTGFVHIAPGHGEDDFALGRAHGIEVPETVGDDGTFNAWVPLFAGLHVYKASVRSAPRSPMRAGCSRAANSCIPIRIPGVPRRR